MYHLLSQQLDNELEDCVTLTGFVPDEELCEHYRLCDLFVLPSKLEGFGIVYLEAMACGKPVVGGNQDGAVDALDHGNLGILVDPDDVAILSQTLIEMFEEKELDTSISESKEIREKMINLFGPANFQLRLAENLKNVGISP
ncbi:MAG: glycosyltransferase [Bacteroidota bacterium]